MATVTTLGKEDLGKVIREAVKSGISETLQTIHSRVDKVETSLSSLRLDTDASVKALSGLQDEKRYLRDKLSEAGAKLEAMEQENKRDNLVFYSVQTAQARGSVAQAGGGNDTFGLLTKNFSVGSLIQVLADMITNVMGVAIEERDISEVIRYPSKHQPTTTPGVIIVHFTRRCVRDRVYRARFALKGKDVGPGYYFYVNEDLTNVNRAIIKILRQKLRDKKVHNVWTYNCKIYCRKLNGQAIHVTSVAQASAIDALLIV